MADRNSPSIGGARGSTVRSTAPIGQPVTVTLSSLNLSRATFAERYTLPQFRLRVVSGPDAGLEAVFAQRVVTIGSAYDSAFVLTDSAISREHLRITGDRVGYRMRDLDSKNGTWFGGSRVIELILGPAATLRMGQTELVYEQLPELHEVALSRETELCGLQGESDDMREVMARLATLAADDLPVAIVGEAGTGKRVAAQAVHRCSPRAEQPLEAFDCSTASAHEALRTLDEDDGLWQRTAGGTLLLLDADELSAVAQSAVARRVQARKGSVPPVRLVVTLTMPLQGAVRDGRLASDFAKLLHKRDVTLPPLRHRKSDIAMLVRQVLAEIEQGRPTGPPLVLSYQTVQALLAYPWPGNVRELRRHLERAAALAVGDLVTFAVGAPSVPLQEVATVKSPASVLPYAEARGQALRNFDRDYCATLLAATANSPSAAAQLAGLTRTSLEQLVARTSPDEPKS